MVVINNQLKNESVKLYLDDNFIGTIETQEAFYDVRVQIMKNKLEGYYIMTSNNEKVQLYSDGKTSKQPEGLFNVSLNLLSKLAFPNKS